uniref:Major facilitator superfamily (MFS) profile domain-containing protein n=1 Tax=Coccolithus braarudii TaxID=221442 RepID=A0A7S0PZA2_9EUKA|mmetsp:Transcript_24934/g.53855  ORF Transcript_24934/g.53855 Transcript_24934/m.53855 type:complete len:463 (+) Transcript_24934:21-1409(+)
MAPTLMLVYSLVTIYALCYQLQAPLEPFLVDKLVTGDGASNAYANLQSFFAFIQLIGSFAVGYCIDKFGLRTMFVVNFAACAASYAILANASTIELLFASKIPSIFQAGFLCAQTAAAKLTPAGEQRSSALGRLTAAYTIGATVGPTLGGYLGTTVSASLAVVGSLIAVALVLLLPSAVDADEETPARAAKVAEANSLSWAARLQEILPIVWPLLLTKFIAGLVNSANNAARPLLLKDTFGLEAAQLGAFMSTMFFGNALLGLQLGRLTALLGGGTATVRICLGVLALGYVGIAGGASVIGSASFSGTLVLFPFLATTLVISLAQFPLATTITAESTALVPAPLKGTLVGCEHALFAGAAMLAPRPGIWLLHNLGVSALGAASGAVYIGLAVAWLVLPREAHGAAGAQALQQGAGPDGETAALLAAKPQQRGDGTSGVTLEGPPPALAPNCVKRNGVKGGQC